MTTMMTGTTTTGRAGVMGQGITRRPYHPNYGNGPARAQLQPAAELQHGFNNNNVIINTGGNRPGGGNNNYWDRYDNKPRPGGNDSGYNRARTTSSPITQAKPNRADLNELNKRQPRPMPADVKRPSSDATASNWKGQQSYAGRDKRPASAQSPQDRINSATPGYSKPATGARPSSAQNKTPPKVQGSYAGKDMPNRPSTQSKPKPSQKPVTATCRRPSPCRAAIAAMARATHSGRHRSLQRNPPR